MGYYLLDYNPGTQQWGYPRRGASLSGTAIMHTAECARDDIGEDTSAEGCASMIANRADWGSYHRLVDSDSIIAMLPWEYEAWQDSETNPWAVGISAALRTSDWTVMPADRRERVYRNLAFCAADFVSYMATKGITVPLVRINGAQARARVPGFCAHGDSGVARSDPGANFDWDLFFQYTQEALSGTAPLEDELANVDTERLNKAVDRILGRDEQRYIHIDKDGRIQPCPEGTPNSWAARSADVADILGIIYRLQDSNSTNKILDAIAKIPGVDSSVIAGLREELAAELREATENISVTLVVDKDGV